MHAILGSLWHTKVRAKKAFGKNISEAIKLVSSEAKNNGFLKTNYKEVKPMQWTQDYIKMITERACMRYWDPSGILKRGLEKQFLVVSQKQ